MDKVRHCDGAHNAPNLKAQLFFQTRRPRVGVGVLQGDKCIQRLSLDAVRSRHNCRLCDGGVPHQRGLHLRGTDAVPGHVDDVVHAPGDPNVAVFVALAAVAGEIEAMVQRKVNLFKTRMVTGHSAQNRRPRSPHSQHSATLPLHHVAFLVNDDGLDAKEGQSRSAGPHGAGGANACDHVGARLGLPPSVRNRTAAVTHRLKVPTPRLRVDGLPDRAEKAQRGARVSSDPAVVHGHEGANDGGCGVKYSHGVLVDHLPQPPGVGVSRHALKAESGGPIEEWPVDEVGVACHPSTVSGAPQHIVVFDVKHILYRGVGAHHVAAGRMHHTFGLTGGAAGVQLEKRCL
mmetsp:Transcript_1627/g.2855  ORF Transcript_1627/g.2855 Transcript_1627/m.2855 type:complete len:345 (-) Transcript_1627:1019-2053(-)